MPESPRTSKEPQLVSRETCSTDNLRFKQAERAYEVCDLKKPVFAWLYGLCEFNATWQSGGGDTPEKVGDRFLPAVVIDLDVITCGKYRFVPSGKVGKLAFKRERHLGEGTGIPLINGETMVGKVYLSCKGHHAMEYPAAKIIGHEAESVVAA